MILSLHVRALVYIYNRLRDSKYCQSVSSIDSCTKGEPSTSLVSGSRFYFPLTMVAPEASSPPKSWLAVSIWVPENHFPRFLEDSMLLQASKYLFDSSLNPLNHS